MSVINDGVSFTIKDNNYNLYPSYGYKPPVTAFPDNLPSRKLSPNFFVKCFYYFGRQKKTHRGSWRLVDFTSTSPFDLEKQ